MTVYAQHPSLRDICRLPTATLLGFPHSIGRVDLVGNDMHGQFLSLAHFYLLYDIAIIVVSSKKVLLTKSLTPSSCAQALPVAGSRNV